MDREQKLFQELKARKSQITAKEYWEMRRLLQQLVSRFRFVFDVDGHHAINSIIESDKVFGESTLFEIWERERGNNWANLAGLMESFTESEEYLQETFGYTFDDEFDN